MQLRGSVTFEPRITMFEGRLHRPAGWWNWSITGEHTVEEA